MKQHTIFYGSSYDRGLDRLLLMWTRIRKEVPDAQLHICYGWDLFDKAYNNNPERQAWKEKMNLMMEQEGIAHHGRVSKKELEEVRGVCGVWAYPTYFTEINCITALSAQKDGLVPVVTDYCALKETVQSGIKVVGDIYEEETAEEYFQALIKVMTDKELWEKESKKAREFAVAYEWESIAKQWARHFTGV